MASCVLTKPNLAIFKSFTLEECLAFHASNLDVCLNIAKNWHFASLNGGLVDYTLKGYPKSQKWSKFIDLVHLTCP